MSRVAFAGVALAIGLTACHPGQPVSPVVQPAIDAATCIATEAAKQDPIVTIAAVCGLDVLTVIEDLLSSDKPAVTSSFAYGEAKGIKATMKAAP